MSRKSVRVPSWENWLGLSAGWRVCRALILVLAAAVVFHQAQAAEAPLSPEQFFGQPLDDVRIPSWQQVVAYYEHLSEHTDRVAFEIVERTAEGRPIVMAIVSSAHNLSRRDAIQDIQRKLADPRGVTAGELDRLVADGRPVLLLYAVEAHHTGGWLAQLAFLHQLATSRSEEVRGWLDNTVVLVLGAINPDGVDYVRGWIEKTRGTAWEGKTTPGLSSFDGEVNRDWYTYSMRETRAVAGVMAQWQPNVVHDLHTMGTNPRTDIRFFTPPYIGPMEPNIHPLIWHMHGELGMAMAGRLLQSRLGGVGYATTYDLWNPAAGYFQHHHAVRILTEASPGRFTTRTTIPFETLRRAAPSQPDPRTPGANFPLVWPGGEWGQKEIIAYSLSSLEGEINHMALNREHYLRAKYQAAGDALALKGPPYAFIIPARQHDVSALAEMVQMLRIGEIEVRQATAAFTIDGIAYDKGDYVIRLDQPFGNWAKAMLEPQHYPESRACETCALNVPFDVAAFSYPPAMGVRVVAASAPLTVPTQLVKEVRRTGGVEGAAHATVFLLSPDQNAAIKGVTRILSEGGQVGRAREASNLAARRWPPGTFIVSATQRAALRALGEELGLVFHGVASLPAVPQQQLRLPRVAVYKSYVTGARNGWGFGRLLFPEYGLPFEFAHDPDIRAGNLRSRFDTIILPAYLSASELLEGHKAGTYPPELTGGLGIEGMKNLSEFVRGGGTLVAIDDANDLVVKEMRLPVKITDGNTVGMFGSGLSKPGTVDGVEFAVPGSYLRMRTADVRHPFSYGMPAEFAGMFNRGQILEPTGPDAIAFVVYPAGELLVSGMAVGSQVLTGKAAAVDVRVGAGHVVLFGIRPEMRLQARGTYKLLLNAVLESASGALGQ